MVDNTLLPHLKLKKKNTSLDKAEVPNNGRSITSLAIASIPFSTKQDNKGHET